MFDGGWVRATPCGDSRDMGMARPPGESVWVASLYLMLHGHVLPDAGHFGHPDLEPWCRPVIYGSGPCVGCPMINS